MGHVLDEAAGSGGGDIEYFRECSPTSAVTTFADMGGGGFSHWLEVAILAALLISLAVLAVTLYRS